jgi:uncharacterized protein YcnI
VTRRLAPLLAATAALLAPAAAGAHVEVLPDKPKLRAEQEFVIRVPNERGVATTKLRVIFPEGLRASQYAPKPGWKRTVQLGRAKVPSGATWEGGRIEPGEYGDFRFLAAPRNAGQAIFRIYQTYADGKTKPWVGPPEKPGATEEEETGVTEAGPSPAVDVTATPDVPSSVVAGADASTPNASKTEATSSDAGVWLGVIAIVIALGAALAAGFLWSTRPATLPPDEPGEGIV